MCLCCWECDKELSEHWLRVKPVTICQRDDILLWESGEWKLFSILRKPWKSYCTYCLFTSYVAKSCSRRSRKFYDYEMPVHLALFFFLKGTVIVGYWQPDIFLEDSIKLVHGYVMIWGILGKQLHINHTGLFCIVVFQSSPCFFYEVQQGFQEQLVA